MSTYRERSRTRSAARSITARNRLCYFILNSELCRGSARGLARSTPLRRRETSSAGVGSGGCRRRHTCGESTAHLRRGDMPEVSRRLRFSSLAPTQEGGESTAYTEPPYSPRCQRHQHRYGTYSLALRLSMRRTFRCDFIVADVQTAILGADFLLHYGLLVDLRHPNTAESTQGGS